MTQTARPKEDISEGNWTPTPIYSRIDEVEPDDTDYVSSEANPNPDIFEVKLDPLGYPRAGENKLTVRLRKTASDDLVAWIYLIAETTIIASKYVSPTTSFDNIELVLTEEQKDLIGNKYGDLRLRVQAGISTTDQCSQCPQASQKWQVTLTGIGGTCVQTGGSCEVANGTWELEHTLGCIWIGAWGPCVVTSVELSYSETEGIWTLLFRDGATYTRTGLNCLQPNVFNLSSVHTCTGWPDTVTLYPI